MQHWNGAENAILRRFLMLNSTISLPSMQPSEGLVGVEIMGGSRQSSAAAGLLLKEK